ncbi:MAG: FecR domain-containing protein [Spirochaetales bacterium]|nr:FecR domain-containing protein [Spirochaetales bacterium]
MGIYKVIVVLFFLVLIFSPVVSCAKKISDNRGSVSEASIDYVSGDVVLNSRKAVIGDNVPDKSTIATGDEGICEIIFDDKNIIKVESNTLFEMDFSGLHKSVNLKEGTLTNVLKKLAALAETEVFTINTSTAVLGVRGTSFFVKADADSTYVCVCNGVLTVGDEKGNNTEEIRAKHHTARLLTKSENGTIVTPAAMLYHTDSDIENVALKIGYEINWEEIE